MECWKLVDKEEKDVDNSKAKKALESYYHFQPDIIISIHFLSLKKKDK